MTYKNPAWAAAAEPTKTLLSQLKVNDLFRYRDEPQTYKVISKNDRTLFYTVLEDGANHDYDLSWPDVPVLQIQQVTDDTSSVIYDAITEPCSQGIANGLPPQRGINGEVESKIMSFFILALTAQQSGTADIFFNYYANANKLVVRAYKNWRENKSGLPDCFEEIYLHEAQPEDIEAVNQKLLSIIASK